MSKAIPCEGESIVKVAAQGLLSLAARGLANPRGAKFRFPPVESAATWFRSSGGAHDGLCGGSAVLDHDVPILTGWVTYIFKPELGVDLLKRAGVLLLVLLVLAILLAR